MARKITMIPQTINPQTRTAMDTRTKRKVAGYARVSTDYEEQITSYEAQVDYYTNYIQSRDDWEFVKVYTDAGISATNTRHREGFQPNGGRCTCRKNRPYHNKECEPFCTKYRGFSYYCT